MSNTMKAIVVDRPGDISVLQLKSVPKPNVKPEWSLVKVKGFGINRSEIFTRQGLSPSVEFPRILGIECVGVIEDSTDLDRLPTGAKVISLMGEMGRAFDGSYAEYVLLPNEQIYPIETDLEWITLATIPETYYTAYLALKSLNIQSSDTVLVRGATSGVGVAFSQLLKAKFPKIQLTGSTRNLNKITQLRNKGYDHILLDDEGRLKTDALFDKVLELVGPKTLTDSLAHTRDYGIVCSAGQLGGQWFLEDFDPIMALQGNRYLTTAYSGRINQQMLQEMLDYLKQYSVDVQPEKIYHLSQVPEIHARMENVDSFGKNIVLMEGNNEIS